MLKAVLFDLDDTLIDWSGFDGNYYELELPRFTRLHEHLTGAGHQMPTVDAMINSFRDRVQDAWADGRETMKSPHFPTILMEMLRDFDLPLDDSHTESLLDAYSWGKVEGVTVFPEVPAALETLLDANIQIAIVTNAFQTMYMRDRELADHDLLRYFETCRFSAADVGYLKPHPAIFEAALNCIGVEPGEAVFVGDNLNADVAGAQRVGMRGVWRDTGYHNSRMARDVIEPDATIETMDEIFPYLDEWFPGWRDG